MQTDVCILLLTTSPSQIGNFDTLRTATRCRDSADPESMKTWKMVLLLILMKLNKLLLQFHAIKVISCKFMQLQKNENSGVIGQFPEVLLKDHPNWFQRCCRHFSWSSWERFTYAFVFTHQPPNRKTLTDNRKRPEFCPDPSLCSGRGELGGN